MIPEADLLERLAEGGTDERWSRDDHVRRVRECFQSHHERMVRWIEVRVGSLAIAREIAAETFVRLLQLKHPVRDLAPYAYRVATYVLSEWWENQATHQRLDARFACKTDNYAASPEPQIVVEELSAVLREALPSLPPRIREAVRLRFWEDYQLEDIVRHFHDKGVVVTQRTIRRWLAEGLELCKKAMDERRT